MNTESTSTSDRWTEHVCALVFCRFNSLLDGWMHFLTSLLFIAPCLAVWPIENYCPLDDPVRSRIKSYRKRTEYADDTCVTFHTEPYHSSAGLSSYHYNQECYERYRGRMAQFDSLESIKFTASDVTMDGYVSAVYTDFTVESGSPLVRTNYGRIMENRTNTYRNFTVLTYEPGVGPKWTWLISLIEEELFIEPELALESDFFQDCHIGSRCHKEMHKIVSSGVDDVVRNKCISEMMEKIDDVKFMNVCKLLCRTAMFDRGLWRPGLLIPCRHVWPPQLICEHPPHLDCIYAKQMGCVYDEKIGKCRRSFVKLRAEDEYGNCKMPKVEYCDCDYCVGEQWQPWSSPEVSCGKALLIRYATRIGTQNVSDCMNSDEECCHELKVVNLKPCSEFYVGTNVSLKEKPCINGILRSSLEGSRCHCFNGYGGIDCQDAVENSFASMVLAAYGLFMSFSALLLLIVVIFLCNERRISRRLPYEDESSTHCSITVNE